MLTACGIETNLKSESSSTRQLQVATVLTACGIETFKLLQCTKIFHIVLQQCLPLAVLKQAATSETIQENKKVATVLTACGIETSLTTNKFSRRFHPVATVLTACGIETNHHFVRCLQSHLAVATVLTACGIETRKCFVLHNVLIVATVLTACGIETPSISSVVPLYSTGCNSAYRLRY